jgi:hypothetical protein
MEVREIQFVHSPRRKKGYLYPLKKYDRWGNLHRLFLSQTGFFWPKIRPLLAGSTTQMCQGTAFFRLRTSFFRPSETSRNTKTKMAITWASELHFRWSWARFKANKELYNFIHINIIVQQRKIKPNKERFNLSIKDKLVKTSKYQKRNKWFMRNLFLMS